MENTKIIIITNFHNDTDRGILKVLKKKQSDFLRKYFYSLQVEENSLNFAPKITVEFPFLFLSKNKINTKVFADWQILFVTDMYPTENYDKEMFGKDTLVMYHTTPSNIEEFLAKTHIKSKRKGKHEPEEKDGYSIINYLINAYDATKDVFDETKYNEAIRKLVDWFPVDIIKAKLNLPDNNLSTAAKLSILHNCLTSNGAAETDKSLLDEKQKVIVDYLANQKDNFCKDYIRNLTELRISLLGS